MTTRRLRIWIDLSNSPHVLFFEPVIDALRRRGHEVVVTARRFCNTLPLARARGLSVRVIGTGNDAGRNHTIKRSMQVFRSWQLRRFARAQRFDVAASHTSRTQVRAAVKLGIPVWAATDYEHADLRGVCAVQCFMIPSVMRRACWRLPAWPRGVIQLYDAVKETVPEASSERRCPTLLAIGDDELLVPSALPDNAHYGHNSNRVGRRPLLRRLGAQDRSDIVVLPRTAHQRRRLQVFTTATPPTDIERALDGSH